MAAPNPKRQRAMREKLAELFAHPQTVLVIHYACQSFNRTEAEGSPRVAAIAVRNLGTGETASFSIHQEAELMRVAHAGVPHRLDDLEFQMLHRFFRFLAENRNMRFVHWNMRDVKFGFPAIEHRFRVLGGDPLVLHDGQKTDLAIAMTSLYGTSYCKGAHFEALAKKNRLSLAGYVKGADEPALFAAGEYAAVLNSCLCKVSLLAKLTELAHDRKLRTDANWWTLNEGRAREAAEFLLDNPAYGIAMLVVTSFGVVLKVLEYLGV